MKGIAKDICPKCKHCEGLDRFTNMYSCKHYNNYPDSAIGMDCDIACYNFEEEGKVKSIASDLCPKCKHCEGMVKDSFYICDESHLDGGLYHLMPAEDELYCTSYEEETDMNKVEGKVAEFCPKCKNCKGTTRESNGVHAWITEVECEDPYDGMVKTLDADSNVCCSMFEPKEDKLIQYYREKSKNYEQILIDISRFVPVDVIDFKDLPKIIEQMRKTGDMYDSVSESYDALFDQKYELQKANEKLEDKVHKLQRRLTEENKRFNRLESDFLIPLVHVLYPGEKVNKPYSEILEDIKELKKFSTYYDRYKTFTDKIQSLLFQDDHTYEFDEIIEEIKNLKVETEENETMYNDLKHWKEKCIARGNDVDVLLSLNKKLDKKISELEKKLNRAEKLLSEELGKTDSWKENCHKAEAAVTFLNSKVEVLEKKLHKADSIRDAVWNEAELKQTISDQEVTIKALLLTIKEMCKEDETNE